MTLIFAQNDFNQVFKMKTRKNLFDKICSFQNLYSAYLKARKTKRYRPYVLEFNRNLEENLLELQYELQNQTYQHSGYREFFVCDSKKRKIKAPSFRDRIIHHALCNIIESIFDKGFIYDSYACRISKGTHKAVKRVETFLRSLYTTTIRERTANAKIYCLKCDISKYFENVDHKILLEIIKRKIADIKVIWLIKKIIDSSSDDKPNSGIPIGNLTSQLFANIYLNELDQFVKHRLRIKYYLRYMDDFLILDSNKKKLHQIKEIIRNFLQDELKLELHPKKVNIFPDNKGIDFLGYVVYAHYKLLRKSTVKRFLKRKKFYNWNSLISWFGYAKFANSYRLRKKIFSYCGEEFCN